MVVLMVPKLDMVAYPTLGPAICDWMEDNLCFGPGDLRGQPLILDAEQKALIARMYEIYPKGHPDEGRRRFKRCALSLAKGMRKTELLAFVAAAELHQDAPVRFCRWGANGQPIGQGVIDPMVFLIAYTEEQSDELAYGTLRVILEEGPLKNDFDIGLERITRLRGDGKAISLATSPQARDGARTTWIGEDETHWWVLPRLKRAHQTVQANIPKRKLSDAWSLEVTTAPEPGTGAVAEDTMQYAQAVAEGRIKDSRLFYFHRQASDEHDLETEEGARAAVIEASGAAASWRDIDSIVELWRDPTTDRAFWERVWCNRLVKSSSKAFDAIRWAELKRNDNPAKSGDLITLGFDGAMFHDATGLVATHVETGYQFVLGAWECPFGLKEWAIPEDEVDDVVMAAFAKYKIWRFYIDPPYWQAWAAKWAGQFGPEKVVEWWTNRRKQMSYALEAFDTAIKSGEISHDGNAVLSRHVANAFKHDLKMRDEEGKALWLIRKERSDSPHKIDLAMASILSWKARQDAVSLGIQKASVYESRGPLIFSL